MCVFEVQRIHDESASKLKSVADPEAGAIEIRQQEFVRVGIKGVGVFDAGHQIFQFRADECVSGVCSVHVKPDLRRRASLSIAHCIRIKRKKIKLSVDNKTLPSVFALTLITLHTHPRIFLANRTDLLEIIERATGSCAECRWDEERHVAFGYIVLDRLSINAENGERDQNYYYYIEDLERKIRIFACQRYKSINCLIIFCRDAKNSTQYANIIKILYRQFNLRQLFFINSFHSRKTYTSLCKAQLVINLLQVRNKFLRILL